MAADWTKLTIDISALNTNDLLNDWRWIVEPTFVALDMSVFGDWFFTNKEGHVFMLDLVSGDLRKICESRAQFMQLREEKTGLDDWFMAELAYLCFERGMQLKAGECFGFQIPPIFNGSVTISNIKVFGLRVYQTIQGQIHRQAKQHPPGTRISGITIDGKKP